MVHQKRLRAAEQGKGITPVLSVVGKISQSVDASETSQADAQLGIDRFESVRFSIKNYGRIQEFSFVYQLQSTQYALEITTVSWFQTAKPDGMVQSKENLLLVQVLERNSVWDGFVFSAPCRMKTLHQASLIFMAGHNDGCWPMAQICATIIRVGPDASGYAEYNYSDTFSNVHGFNIGKSWRLNSTKLRGNVFKRGWRHKLANNFGFVRYTEQNEPAMPVQHGTDCFDGFGALPRTLLELYSVRFTFRDELSQISFVHCDPVSFSGLIKGV